jgi:hypothetical protein
MRQTKNGPEELAIAVSIRLAPTQPAMSGPSGPNSVRVRCLLVFRVPVRRRTNERRGRKAPCQMIYPELPGKDGCLTSGV